MRFASNTYSFKNITDYDCFSCLLFSMDEIIRFIKTDGLDKLIEKLESWAEGAIKMIPNLFLSVLVFILFWLLSRWTYKIVRSLLKKTHVNINMEHLIANFCRILVLIIGFTVVLAILQLEKTVFSLLAGVGVVGLALGFAFQDLASNFISGLMLAIRSPIKINDVVEIKGLLGTVIDIRLRDTLLRNSSGQDIFIPNKEFTSSYFTNYSSNGKRRVEVAVGIDYENNPSDALVVIQKALAEVQGCLTDPSPMAYVKELGESSVNLVGQFWIKYPGENFALLQSEAIIKIKESLEKHKFNIPFPIRTLNFDPETKQMIAKFYS
jgi:small conductance mechanosensitive channel